jgi:hypothetical protein
MLYLEQPHDRRAIVAYRDASSVGDELVHPTRSERRSDGVRDRLTGVDVAYQLGLALCVVHIRVVISRASRRCAAKGDLWGY